jgi:quinate dehydrogenase
LLDEGRVTGAVNTVVITEENGRRIYTGTNTDCIGIRDALLSKTPPEKSQVSDAGMVIGGGGTTRSAVYALNKYLGCSPIYLVNREDQEVRDVINHFAETLDVELIHLSSVGMADKITAPRYIVGAIPDFPPSTPAEVTVREIVKNVLNKPGKGILLDMCYKPVFTHILAMAKDSGWQIVDGIQAMIGQGMAQVSIWSGLQKESIPTEAVSKLVREEVERKSQS